MNQRLVKALFSVSAALAVAHAATIGSLAQTRPNTAAAAPTPTAPYKAPRTPAGQPSFEGVWTRGGGPVYSYDIQAPAPAVAYPGRDLVANWRPIIVDPPDGKIPYKPEAAKRREYLYQAAFNPKTVEELDPQNRCVPGAPPRTAYQGSFQIIQPAGYVVFLQEWAHQYRIVPLDNRPHLTDKVKLYAADHRGRWEGDTLVIDVANFNGRNWLDVGGDIRTDAFHVVERWTRVGPDALRWEATIEDPNLYTRPWKMQQTLRQQRDGKNPYYLLEEACHEGNRALSNLVSTPEKK